MDKLKPYIYVSREELIKRLIWMLDFNYHGYDAGNKKRQVCMKLNHATRKIIATSIADGLEPEFGIEPPPINK